MESSIHAEIELRITNETEIENQVKLRKKIKEKTTILLFVNNKETRFYLAFQYDQLHLLKKIHKKFHEKISLTL